MPIDADPVLSFSAPVRASARVQAAPSAVFELIHVLSRMGLPEGKTRNMGWVHELQNRREDLAQRVRGFWEHEVSHAQLIGLELFLLAAQGYAKSLDAQAFIDDLPRLIQQEATLKELESEDEEHREMAELVLFRLDALRDPAKLSSYQRLLLELWQEMRPAWEGEGVGRVRAECERMNRELGAGADTLAVLPAKHFARFEAFREMVQRFQEEGNVLLTPLFFIGGGGHSFDLGGQLFVGFGLEGDSSLRKKEQDAAALAARTKAFADPTRLMILALICDFSATLTVSDIATLFGITQPTVSGHLKLLKEAGLVSFTKKGNKSFYCADVEAIERLLGELKVFVTPLRSQ
jgi:ArsR family transcriptional regulator, arsenate/arsenite/antimonite-responsive transcriptional repressor